MAVSGLTGNNAADTLVGGQGTDPLDGGSGINCLILDDSLATGTNCLPMTASAGGPYNVNESQSVSLAATGTHPYLKLSSLRFDWDFDNNGSFDDWTYERDHHRGRCLGLAGLGPLRVGLAAR